VKAWQKIIADIIIFVMVSANISFAAPREESVSRGRFVYKEYSISEGRSTLKMGTSQAASYLLGYRAAPENIRSRTTRTSRFAEDLVEALGGELPARFAEDFTDEQAKEWAIIAVQERLRKGGDYYEWELDLIAEAILYDAQMEAEDEGRGDEWKSRDIMAMKDKITPIAEGIWEQVVERRKALAEEVEQEDDQGVGLEQLVDETLELIKTVKERFPEESTPGVANVVQKVRRELDYAEAILTEDEFERVRINWREGIDNTDIAPRVLLFAALSSKIASLAWKGNTTKAVIESELDVRTFKSVQEPLDRLVLNLQTSEHLPQADRSLFSRFGENEDGIARRDWIKLTGGALLGAAAGWPAAIAWYKSRNRRFGLAPAGKQTSQTPAEVAVRNAAEIARQAAAEAALAQECRTHMGNVNTLFQGLHVDGRRRIRRAFTYNGNFQSYTDAFSDEQRLQILRRYFNEPDAQDLNSLRTQRERRDALQLAYLTSLTQEDIIRLVGERVNLHLRDTGLHFDPDIMQIAADESGLPLNFILAVMFRETDDFEPRRVNPNDGHGLMQINRNTLKEYMGYLLDENGKEIAGTNMLREAGIIQEDLLPAGEERTEQLERILLDPNLNLRIGAYILNDCMSMVREQFNPNENVTEDNLYRFTLAMYNRGPYYYTQKAIAIARLVGADPTDFEQVRPYYLPSLLFRNTTWPSIRNRLPQRFRSNRFLSRVGARIMTNYIAYIYGGLAAPARNGNREEYTGFYPLLNGMIAVPQNIKDELIPQPVQPEDSSRFAENEGRIDPMLFDVLFELNAKGIERFLSILAYYGKKGVKVEADEVAKFQGEVRASLSRLAKAEGVSSRGLYQRLFGSLTAEGKADVMEGVMRSGVLYDWGWMHEELKGIYPLALEHKQAYHGTVDTLQDNHDAFTAVGAEQRREQMYVQIEDMRNRESSNVMSDVVDTMRSIERAQQADYRNAKNNESAMLTFAQMRKNLRGQLRAFGSLEVFTAEIKGQLDEFSQIKEEIEEIARQAEGADTPQPESRFAEDTDLADDVTAGDVEEYLREMRLETEAPEQLIGTIKRQLISDAMPVPEVANRAFGLNARQLSVAMDARLLTPAASEGEVPFVLNLSNGEEAGIISDTVAGLIKREKVRADAAEYILSLITEEGSRMKWVGVRYKYNTVTPAIVDRKEEDGEVIVMTPTQALTALYYGIIFVHEKITDEAFKFCTAPKWTDVDEEVLDILVGKGFGIVRNIEEYRQETRRQIAKDETIDLEVECTRLYDDLFLGKVAGMTPVIWPGDTGISDGKQEILFYGNPGIITVTKSLLNRATELVKKHDYEHEAAILDLALNSAPLLKREELADILLSRGYCASKLRKYNEATTLFEKAAKLGYGSADSVKLAAIYYEIGDSYFQQGKFEQSRASFLLAKRTDPESLGEIATEALAELDEAVKESGSKFAESDTAVEEYIETYAPGAYFSDDPISEVISAIADDPFIVEHYGGLEDEGRRVIGRYLRSGRCKDEYVIINAARDLCRTDSRFRLLKAVRLLVTSFIAIKHDFINPASIDLIYDYLNKIPIGLDIGFEEATMLRLPSVEDLSHEELHDILTEADDMVQLAMESPMRPAAESDVSAEAKALLEATLKAAGVSTGSRFAESGSKSLQVKQLESGTKEAEIFGLLLAAESYKDRISYLRMLDSLDGEEAMWRLYLQGKEEIDRATEKPYSFMMQNLAIADFMRRGRVVLELPDGDWVSKVIEEIGKMEQDEHRSFRLPSGVTNDEARINSIIAQVGLAFTTSEARKQQINYAKWEASPNSNLREIRMVAGGGPDAMMLRVTMGEYGKAGPPSYGLRAHTHTLSPGAWIPSFAASDSGDGTYRGDFSEKMLKVKPSGPKMITTGLGVTWYELRRPGWLSRRVISEAEAYAMLEVETLQGEDLDPDKAWAFLTESKKQNRWGVALTPHTISRIGYGDMAGCIKIEVAKEIESPKGLSRFAETRGTIEFKGLTAELEQVITDIFDNNIYGKSGYCLVASKGTAPSLEVVGDEVRCVITKATAKNVEKQFNKLLKDATNKFQKHHRGEGKAAIARRKALTPVIPEGTVRVIPKKAIPVMAKRDVDRIAGKATDKPIELINKRTEPLNPREWSILEEQTRRLCNVARGEMEDVLRIQKGPNARLIFRTVDDLANLNEAGFRPLDGPGRIIAKGEDTEAATIAVIRKSDQGQQPKLLYMVVFTKRLFEEETPGMPEFLGVLSHELLGHVRTNETIGLCRKQDESEVRAYGVSIDFLKRYVESQQLLAVSNHQIRNLIEILEEEVIPEHEKRLRSHQQALRSRFGEIESRLKEMRLQRESQTDL